MRNAQKKYFKTRETYWISRSKEFEKRVDDYLENINQPKLEL